MIGADLLEVGEAYLELRRTVKATERLASSRLIEWADLIGTTDDLDRRRVVRMFLACEDIWIAWAEEETARRRALAQEKL